jgi:mannose-6-phosphate isomerase
VLYPLTFHPIFKERIWGGRKLEKLFDKGLPPDQRIGESWEISDRPDAVSVIAHGPLAGKSLRWLMETKAEEILGRTVGSGARFPLLIKILDATSTLSLQVHPPASVAGRLGGEPKTEMWYIADAQPDAELFVGLKPGVTRKEFEQRIANGTVADCFHRIRVRAGDAMYLPSGRVHAIGEGLVIFEIQQNSDTTYRVFDWHRLGDDGRPRDLHVAESLASIDFDDFEPGLVTTEFSGDLFRKRSLVAGALFGVEECECSAGMHLHFHGREMLILGVLSGKLTIEHQGSQIEIGPGRFTLIPAAVQEFDLEADTQARFLQVKLGQPRMDANTRQ